MNRWKHFENSIGDLCKTFHCFNNFLSSTAGSKCWKIDSIRSLNCLNESMELWYSVAHHCNGWLRSVCESNKHTSVSLKSSIPFMSAWKSSKFSGHPISPSPSYVICDKWSQKSLSMWKKCLLDKNFRGITITNSMKYVRRLKTYDEDLACHLAFLLVSKCWWCWTHQHVSGSPW